MPGANLTRVEAEERKSIVSAPISYHVQLDLTRDARTFGSTTTICFGAEPGSETFLDLIADNVTEIILNDEALDPAQVFEDNRIALTGLRRRNEVTVKADCVYSNTGEGLHRSVDPSDGNIYLYSQFEVPDARRVYAVFDQPDLKATFDFTVLAPKSWIVTSNMPVKSKEDVDDVTHRRGVLGDHEPESARSWTFETTPIMSSYLTAICAVRTPNGTPPTSTRTAAPCLWPSTAVRRSPPRSPRTSTTCSTSPRRASRSTPRRGACPTRTPSSTRSTCPSTTRRDGEHRHGHDPRPVRVRVEGHRRARRAPRGDRAARARPHVVRRLRDDEWWNDLWLNESFAEFTSTLATAEATEWHDAWATFCSGEKSWALNQDQLSTTHPIVAPINDLNDTYVNFDGITYAKGASVLKQLVYYVGRERFFQGINQYLNKYAYSNATLADLLHELEKASAAISRRGAPSGWRSPASTRSPPRSRRTRTAPSPRSRSTRPPPPSTRCCARIASRSASTTRIRPPARSCAPTASSLTWTANPPW